MTKTSVPRWKTAIRRKFISVPVRYAINHHLITSTTTVIDYGCGRGDDVVGLHKMGFSRVFGWDPHFTSQIPEPLPQTGDVVLLSYVLNVIEDPKERADVLRKAYGCTKFGGWLVVTVRRGDRLPNCRKYGDGQLTSTGTFQLMYQHEDFVDYITRALKPTEARYFKVGSGTIAFVKRTHWVV